MTQESTTVVLVGHNPGVEDLVASLTGRSVSMPTSALAVIALSGPWSTARTRPLSCEHRDARPWAERKSTGSSVHRSRKDAFVGDPVTSSAGKRRCHNRIRHIAASEC